MSNKNAAKRRENPADTVNDLEQQLILRLPPGPAMALRHDVQTGSLTLKDKLSIEMQPDMRHARVRYGGEIFSAKLVDLPCIIDSLKTVDKKTFYKTADINKMLICTTEDDLSQEESDSPKKKDKEQKKFIYNHGITPPLKNVKKRRFRKTLKKKFMDQPEIEKEVKRLFRYDAEAIDVKWEIIRDEAEATTSGQIMEGSTSSRKIPAGLLQNEQETSMDVASYFGEVSSSEDEDKDINIMDSGEDEASRGPSTPRISFGSLDRTASESLDVPETDTGFQQYKLSELSSQLTQIRQKRHRKRLESMEANIEKEKLQDDYDDQLSQADSDKFDI
ncbi:transcription initiation factor TFIID subunit 7 [Patella vulgata]|uniref:transcription initiation factor TFIID subunit 7 n=1 Tax=Patella vulgata TaxID=6465 RepID=UPI00217FEDB2|nr:transcription initiation factor TFIID subunit 7 [Patella vulgata]